MYFSAMGGISMTGIFLVEFKEEFDVSTTTVSVIGSIKIGLVMFCGKDFFSVFIFQETCNAI